MTTTYLRTLVPAATAGLAAAAAWFLGLRAAALARQLTSTAGPGVDDVIAVGVLAAGGAVALWYLLTYVLVAVVLTARVVGTRTATLEAAVRRWGFPGLRRVLLSAAAAGAGLAVGTLPAGATSEQDLPTDLRWGAAATSAVPVAPAAATTVATPPPGPLPAGRAPGRTEQPSAPVVQPSEPADGTGSAPPTSPGSPAAGTSIPTAAGAPAQPTAGTRAPTAGPDRRGEPTDAVRTVRPGDTLWAIAAEHLGSGATAADIAAAWPAWHETNRAVIGADPNLIHPGQQLLTPKEAS